MSTFPILHTKRLDLVEIKHFHSDGLFKLFGDESVTKYYNIIPLKNKNETHQIIDFFKSRFESNSGIRRGIAFKGEENIIGTVGFNKYTKHHNSNIGYDLQQEHWNKGIMTEALSAVLKYGFEVLEVNRIEAEVMQGNFISEKVLEKLNFKKEGVLREWLFWNGKHFDMSMYSLLKSEYSDQII